MVNLSFGIVALGANLPSSGQSPAGTLRRTLNILHGDSRMAITALSRIWITPAHPPGSGPDFANAVALVSTPLAAEALLARLHEIEAEAGRDRAAGRWSARVLDLDLIALDAQVLPSPPVLQDWIDLPPAAQAERLPGQLVLPHPRMQDRGFVLAPLAEIAPQWRHPLAGRSVAEMLGALGPEALEGMRPVGWHEPGELLDKAGPDAH